MGSKLYALLLYVYPKAFRREYGESMQQLFDDQQRAARGFGGRAWLWLKTLRDLAISLPAVYANERRRASLSSRWNGAVFVWTVVVLLGVTFFLAAVVLPSWISRMPISGEAALIESSVLAPAGAAGPFRAVLRVALALASTVLAIGAFLFALAQRSLLTGLATFIAGAAVTILPLGLLPWLSLPHDPFSVAVWWALGIWPVFALAWVALAVGARLTQPAGDT
jgi:hypothetical protein